MEEQVFLGKTELDWVKESRDLGLPDDFCQGGFKAVKMAAAQEDDYRWQARLSSSVEGRKSFLKNWASMWEFWRVLETPDSLDPGFKEAMRHSMGTKCWALFSGDALGQSCGVMGPTGWLTGWEQSKKQVEEMIGSKLGQAMAREAAKRSWRQAFVSTPEAKEDVRWKRCWGLAISGYPNEMGTSEKIDDAWPFELAMDLMFEGFGGALRARTKTVSGGSFRIFGARGGIEAQDSVAGQMLQETVESLLIWSPSSEEIARCSDKSLACAVEALKCAREIMCVLRHEKQLKPRSMGLTRDLAEFESRFVRAWMDRTVAEGRKSRATPRM